MPGEISPVVMGKHSSYTNAKQQCEHIMHKQHSSHEAFGALHNTIRRGDLVGVKGLPGKSKRGELSVFPTSFIVLAPCLHMLPKYKLENQVTIR